MRIPLTAGRSWKLLFWSCAAVILVLALMPATPDVPGTGWDKSNHVAAFLVLTVLGCAAYPGRLGAIVAGAVLYGALIEVLQSFTEYRSGDWADLIADAVGVLAGRALFALTRLRRR